MIRITLTSTGFYANKPNVHTFELADDVLAVDTKDKKVYLRELNAEDIEKWFVEKQLKDAPIMNRIISIHVKKNGY